MNLVIFFVLNQILQFRISEMKTAKPRIASPRIVGIRKTLKYVMMNSYKAENKQRNRITICLYMIGYDHSDIIYFRMVKFFLVEVIHNKKRTFTKFRKRKTMSYRVVQDY